MRCVAVPRASTMMGSCSLARHFQPPLVISIIIILTHTLFSRDIYILPYLLTLTTRFAHCTRPRLLPCPPPRRRPRPCGESPQRQTSLRSELLIGDRGAQHRPPNAGETTVDDRLQLLTVHRDADLNVSRAVGRTRHRAYRNVDADFRPLGSSSRQEWSTS